MIFKSRSMVDYAHDMRMEEKAREDKRLQHTKKFEWFLELLTNSHNQSYFNDKVQETIAAEVSPDVHADNGQMMAFCASVYQRKLNEVLCSDAFNYYDTARYFGFAHTMNLEDCI